MTRIRFLFATAVLIVLATTVAACGGGGGHSDESPQAVIDRATLKGIESADVNASIKVDASGAEGGNLDVSLSGPFESVEGGSTPKLDMTASAKGRMNGKGVDFEGGLVLLPNSAYVNYQGTEYEVDPTTFSFVESAIKQAQQQGASEGESTGSSACKGAVEDLAVGDFVDNLQNEGEADVGGTSTTKVSGELDVAGAIDNLLKLYSDPACKSQLNAAGGSLPSSAELNAAKDEVRKSVKSAEVDVYVGDDDIVRRVSGQLEIQPKDGGSGPSSAKVSFDISLEGVNEDQEIVAPETTKPLSALFQRLGVNPLELLGALQGEGGNPAELLEGIGAESTNGF